MDPACVVRFLMVGGDFAVDVLSDPPKNVPKLQDILALTAGTD
jgi:hypothetical protein